MKFIIRLVIYNKVHHERLVTMTVESAKSPVSAKTPASAADSGADSGGDDDTKGQVRSLSVNSCNVSDGLLKNSSMYPRYYVPYYFQIRLQIMYCTGIIYVKS